MNYMKIRLLKNIVLAAATSMFIASCATNGEQAVPKSLGDAAVDSVTKDTDPITKTAIRNTTGYGTDPIEERTSGLLNSLTR